MQGKIIAFLLLASSLMKLNGEHLTSPIIISGIEKSPQNFPSHAFPFTGAFGHPINAMMTVIPAIANYLAKNIIKYPVEFPIFNHRKQPTTNPNL
jgi:hypothetical protein